MSARGQRGESVRWLAADSLWRLIFSSASHPFTLVGEPAEIDDCDGDLSLATHNYFPHDSLAIEKRAFCWRAFHRNLDDRH